MDWPSRDRMLKGRRGKYPYFSRLLQLYDHVLAQVDPEPNVLSGGISFVFL